MKLKHDELLSSFACNFNFCRYIKEVSYTLTSLAQNQLQTTRTEIASTDIPGKFGTTPNLLSLTKVGQYGLTPSKLR